MKQILASLLIGATTLLSGCGDAEQSDSAPAERATSVIVVTALSRDIDYVLNALGSVESIHHPVISAEASGQIVSIDVEEGQSAPTGTVLARIDPATHQLAADTAAAELQRQQVSLENQRKEVARLQRLAESQSVSKDQLEDQQDNLAMAEAQRQMADTQWQQAQLMVAKTSVLAPTAGIISRRSVSLGDYVTPGTPLFAMVSVDRLKARLAFPEHEVSKISIGQRVRLTSPAAPDTPAEGLIMGINPQISIHNRAIEVTVEFDNPGGWLPGSSVDAQLLIKRQTGALTLPSTSVVIRQGGPVVFLVNKGRAQIQPVTTGWRGADWIEIQSGISADDRVVSHGAALISDGSLLAERL
ncbi:efflux RND transporter periplasmic adaptor subunit [Halieaceae bacterium IMCC14734]|uniref:Efflux RND transporter periplasmic adaptor subunit n=1 Tax=Candidatus Litorirhabdus singularis TaxID=2518993 RepID=A0ABT3TIQ4_9GAMM|nr:efflux RND transporter periplasmic adaptor subunit [Candidatus Litorirhabdus singularis]MCX2982208.1 efflux RND transporter periplasmic adaptor subunit [Candidatus Litorirhabdus singularis]